jgi:UDP-glucose 4-epimerase
VRSRRITLNTQGLQRRDFIAISEVCRALLFLCGRDVRTDCNIFNVGSGDAPTMLELARRIAIRTRQRLGFEPEIRFGRDRDTVGEGDLDFRTDRLRQMGFAFLPGADDVELDRLIDHCVAEEAVS